jgi:hypothetical protein
MQFRAVAVGVELGVTGKLRGRSVVVGRVNVSKTRHDDPGEGESRGPSATQARRLVWDGATSSQCTVTRAEAVSSEWWSEAPTQRLRVVLDGGRAKE